MRGASGPFPSPLAVCLNSSSASRRPGHGGMGDQEPVSSAQVPGGGPPGIGARVLPALRSYGSASLFGTGTQFVCTIVAGAIVVVALLAPQSLGVRADVAPLTLAAVL